MGQVPFQIVNNSIQIEGRVNGHPTVFTLDTGDAIGPVFNAADASRLHLPQIGVIGVSGAGGATENYGTEATIEFDGDEFPQEPGSIDPNLNGSSLLGLPFFLKVASVLQFDFGKGALTMVSRGNVNRFVTVDGKCPHCNACRSAGDIYNSSATECCQCGRPFDDR